MKYFILASILLLTACSTPKEQEKLNSSEQQPISFDAYSEELKAHIVDTIILNIDEKTPLKSPLLQYLPKRNQLAVMNIPNQSIDIYELPKGVLSERIQLLEEGPNGVGKIRQFRIDEARNLIYLVNADTYQFFSMSFDGLIQKRINFNREGAPKVSVTSWQPMLIKWPLVYMSSTPYRDYNNTNFYESEKLMTILNIETEEINYFLVYPEEMKHKLWGPNLSSKFYAYDSLGDRIVYSWPATAQLTVVEGEKLSYVDRPSQKLDVQPESVQEVPKNFEESHMIYVKNSQYGKIYHDPVRKLFYRSALSAVPEQYWNSSDYDEQNMHPFSLMVLNEDLALQEEFVFPHLTYYDFMTFSTLTAFYMMRIPEQEDELVFHGFNFQK